MANFNSTFHIMHQLGHDVTYVGNEKAGGKNYEFIDKKTGQKYYADASDPGHIRFMDKSGKQHTVTEYTGPGDGKGTVKGDITDTVGGNARNTNINVDLKRTAQQSDVYTGEGGTKYATVGGKKNAKQGDVQPQYIDTPDKGTGGT